MQRERIKSCPFCGFKLVDINRTNEHSCWVQCASPRCEARAQSSSTREGAIRIWNRRTKRKTTTVDVLIVIDDDKKEVA